MAMERLLATLVVAALGLSACGESKTVNDDGAAPSRPSSPSEGVEASFDDDSARLADKEATAAAGTADRAPAIDEDPNRGRPAPRASSTTTTTQCADVGTFQGCLTHGGPTPGSEEDCQSANPVGPCQPRVVLWNSSTHAGPEYGEVVRAEPGEEITALAAGFPARSEVAFCFGEANAGCLLHEVQRADSDGTATLVIQLSADAAPGDYVVTVCHCVSADEETRASQSLAVTNRSGV